MLISLKLWAIRLLVPHHPLALFTLMLVLFIGDVAANAATVAISPSAAAAVVGYVLGESRHLGCLR